MDRYVWIIRKFLVNIFQEQCNPIRFGHFKIEYFNENYVLPQLLLIH